MYPSFGSLGQIGTYGFMGGMGGLYGALVPYGSLTLTESSPPQSFTEPLSLTEAKSFLQLENDKQDTDVSALIIGARIQAEIGQNRDLVRKQWDLAFDYWRDFRIELRDPLVSVDLMQYRDSSGTVTPMVENADYVVDKAKHPGTLAPPYSRMIWPAFVPWPSSSILVRFRSGFAPDAAWWSDTGALVKTGMKMLITQWFENRIPFVLGPGAAMEYPYAVTSCLTSGAVERAR